MTETAQSAITMHHLCIFKERFPCVQRDQLSFTKNGNMTKVRRSTMWTAGSVMWLKRVIKGGKANDSDGDYSAHNSTVHESSSGS